VAEQIKSLILSGKLKPGEKLPSERDLSKAIGIGRLSLREGFRILESSGILVTRYGTQSGSYVACAGIEQLTAAFSDILRLGDITLSQLTEARLEIGLINLKYFMERAGAEDIQQLDDCIRDIEKKLKTGLQTREANIYFHQLIARGAKNPVFILLHNALLDVWRQFLSKFESPPEHARKVLAGKKKILKYIKAKDFQRAAETMKEYITYSGHRIAFLIEKAEKTQ
jgi:GntR family transcriptional repressor for pyruvate dehydrogenase complex